MGYVPECRCAFAFENQYCALILKKSMNSELKSMNLEIIKANIKAQGDLL